MKRIVRFIFLTIVISLCLSVFATAEEYTYEEPVELLSSSSITTAILNGNCGFAGSSLVKWKLNRTTGVLTIDGMGSMGDYYLEDDIPWYEFRTDIKKVVIKSGVTQIGYRSFYNCTYLNSIYIPKSVKQIANSAFALSPGLHTVYYEGTASQWQDIDIGVLNTYLTNSTFYYNQTVPGSSSTSIIYGDCGAVGSDLIWAFDTSSNILAIVGNGAMQDWTKATVPWVDYKPFLKAVTISSGVTSIGNYAFADCPNLISASIPEGITHIGLAAFENCTNMISAALPSTIVSIGPGAFYDCDGIKSFDLTNNLTEIGSFAFAYCDGISLMDIPGSVKSLGDYSVTFCSNLAEVILRDGVMTIGECALSYCPALACVTIPASVTSIETNAFSGCYNLFYVFYLSNALQWNSINIADDNDPLFNAALIYVVEEHQHTEVIDKAVEATCTKSGLTEGSHCETCGEVLAEQTAIPAIGHSYTSVTIVATCTESGYITYTCSACGDTYTEDGAAAVGHSYDNDLDADCNNCGEAREILRPEPPTVSGTVSNGSGASIEINGESVQVNEDGSFVLPAEGEFDVAIKKGGCLTYTIKGVNVTDADIDLGEIVMVAGDVNEDDKINIADMGVFRQEFGKTGSDISNTYTDVNGDGKVNIADMGVFRQNFGKTAEKDCTVTYE